MDSDPTYGTRDLALSGAFAMPAMVARPRVTHAPAAVNGWQHGEPAHLAGGGAPLAKITATRVLGTLPFAVRPIGTRLFGTGLDETTKPATDRSSRSAPEPLIV